MRVLFDVILKEVINQCRATIPSDIAITRDISPDCVMILSDLADMVRRVLNGTEELVEIV